MAAMVENTGTSIAGSSHEHGSVAMVTLIAAPVLRLVYPPYVAKFLKERKRYELKVDSKKVELPSLRITLYSASINHSLLKSLIFVRASEDIKTNATLESLKDEKSEKFIKGLISNESDEVNPAQLQKAMWGRKVRVHIANSFAQITTFCADVFSRLEAAGFEDLKSDNLEYTIKMMIKRVRPPALETAMEERIQVEPGLKDKIW